MKSEHAGQLKIVADINEPMPPYPEEAREAGKDGDPAIDQAALTTVRTWKFKVTRGERAGFAIKLLYRMSCEPSNTMRMRPESADLVS
jgi:outer membrane biosynthesis protein TonB